VNYTPLEQALQPVIVTETTVQTVWFTIVCTWMLLALGDFCYSVGRVMIQSSYEGKILTTDAERSAAARKCWGKFMTNLAGCALISFLFY
jgi:hypothetical protein